MSLIMTIYLNDGIVMASDSRTTLTTIKENNDGKTEVNTFPFSDSTYKTFSAPNNCGISTCGDSSFLDKPISGFIEKYLVEKVNPETTVEELANNITDYFTELESNKTTIFHVCGYVKDENGNLNSKVYRCLTGTNKKIEDIGTEFQGALWDGETKTLRQLLKDQISSPLIIGETEWEVEENGDKKIVKAFVLKKDGITYYEDSPIAWNLMTIPDAIDFVEFAFNTTINNMKFQSIAKTVGGPVNILVIKPNEIKWARRNNLL